MCKNASVQTHGRSRTRLRTAVTALLDETEPERVTVTDIVTAAGMTRPTFYAIYGDLPTAFADAALHRLSSTFEEFSLDVTRPTENLSDDMGRALLAIVTRLEEHERFYSRILHGPGGHHVLAAIIDFIAARLSSHSPVSGSLHDGYLPPSEVTTGLAAGATWLTLSWLDEVPRRPAGQFAELLRDFILRAVFGGLGRLAKEDAA